jgi:ribosomal-protein-alanine N-acetyltransferase
MEQQPTPAHPVALEAQLQVSDESADVPLPQPILATTRLIVRPMYLKDAPSMSLNGDSPAITKYMSLSFPSPYTLDQAKSWIALNIGRSQQTDFVICEATSPDTPIGGIGLKLGSDISSHTAELGFWVGEKYWGKGYTTEVLEGFTTWSFESWEGKNGQRLRKLWGKVFDGNMASMRCFEKCGYIREGVLRGHVEKHGEIMDMHMFGLTKVDWQARQERDGFR